MNGPPRNIEDDARYFMERLEAWQDANRDMGERFAKVLEQRAELLGALEDVAEAFNATDPKCSCDAALGSREQAHPPGSFHHESCRIAKMLRARAAIAKAVPTVFPSRAERAAASAAAGLCTDCDEASPEEAAQCATCGGTGKVVP